RRKADVSRSPGSAGPEQPPASASMVFAWFPFPGLGEGDSDTAGRPGDQCCEPLGAGQIGERGGWAITQAGTVLDPAPVVVGAAKRDAECSGKRRFDRARVGARMAPGIPPPGAQDRK